VTRLSESVRLLKKLNQTRRDFGRGHWHEISADNQLERHDAELRLVRGANGDKTWTRGRLVGES
jgi:hypothetical protein